MTTPSGITVVAVPAFNESTLQFVNMTARRLNSKTSKPESAFLLQYAGYPSSIGFFQDWIVFFSDKRNNNTEQIIIYQSNLIDNLFLAATLTQKVVGPSSSYVLWSALINSSVYMLIRSDQLVVLYRLELGSNSLVYSVKLTDSLRTFGGSAHNFENTTLHSFWEDQAGNWITTNVSLELGSFETLCISKLFSLRSACLKYRHHHFGFICSSIKIPVTGIIVILQVLLNPLCWLAG